MNFKNLKQKTLLIQLMVLLSSTLSWAQVAERYVSYGFNQCVREYWYNRVYQYNVNVAMSNCMYQWAEVEAFQFEPNGVLSCKMQGVPNLLYGEEAEICYERYSPHSLKTINVLRSTHYYRYEWYNMGNNCYACLQWHNTQSYRQVHYAFCDHLPPPTISKSASNVELVHAAHMAGQVNFVSKTTGLVGNCSSNQENPLATLDSFYAKESLFCRQYRGSQWHVHYNTKEEQNRIRLFPSPNSGRALDVFGRPLDTQVATHLDSSGTHIAGSKYGQNALYAIDENGELYVSTYSRVGSFHHSSILGGKPVLSAGMITIVQGKIVKITNESGHYKPTNDQLVAAVRALRAKGYDIQKSAVRDFADNQVPIEKSGREIKDECIKMTYTAANPNWITYKDQCIEHGLHTEGISYRIIRACNGNPQCVTNKKVAYITHNDVTGLFGLQPPAKLQPAFTTH
ncbi:MAG: hypothetical protein HQK52_04660 [Oligoflexia bacterium]|nr:hypothetical protein [Oligoflexia bacterium]